MPPLVDPPRIHDGPAPTNCRRIPVGELSPPPRSCEGPEDGPDADLQPIRDHGISLLATFTAAMLLIVGIAALAAAIDRMWVLLPAMAIDLSLTAMVIAMIARLLEDTDGH